MTDRYEPMTLAEGAALAREGEAQDAVERMGLCAHGGACLRVMGLLCFKEPGYADGWGAEAQQAREDAARWMGCMDCDEWEEGA